MAPARRFSPHIAKLRNAFFIQRHSSEERGILFLLTFEEWLQIWQDSGHLHERGRKKGQYCMARFNDTGPYAVWNVKIMQHCLNVAEGQIGRKASFETRRKQSCSMRGIKKSEEHKQKDREAHLGKKHSEASLQKMRGIKHSPERLMKAAEGKVAARARRLVALLV